MTPLEQLTAWAEQGFYVSLSINDGHEGELGKPSYCLWVSNHDGGYELGANDIFGSLEEAVAATLAAPWEKWEEPDECCGINCDTPGEPGHAAVSIKEE